MTLNSQFYFTSFSGVMEYKLGSIFRLNLDFERLVSGDFWEYFFTARIELLCYVTSKKSLLASWNVSEGEKDAYIIDYSIGPNNNGKRERKRERERERERQSETGEDKNE